MAWEFKKKIEEVENLQMCRQVPNDELYEKIRRA